MKSIAEWYVLLGVIDPQIMYSSAVYEICYQIMKYPPYAMQAIFLTILTVVRYISNLQNLNHEEFF